MQRKAKKWNGKEYDEYILPSGAKTIADLDEEIQCAICGRLVKYGDCYTSHTVHTDFGIGYAVCEDCYTEELKNVTT